MIVTYITKNLSARLSKTQLQGDPVCVLCESTRSILVSFRSAVPALSFYDANYFLIYLT